MKIKEDLSAFHTVADSFHIHEKKHTYINTPDISSGNCSVTSERNKRTSFNKITDYVKKQLTNPNITPNEKKELATYYKAILEPFAAKKRLIDYIFFFRLISKNIKVNKGRKLLKEFESGALTKKNANNNNTVKNLKEKGRYLKVPLNPYFDINPAFQLREAPLGSFVVWEGPSSYFFYQKKGEAYFREVIKMSDIDHPPPEVIIIPKTENLEEQIELLTAQKETLQILKNAGLVYESFDEAAKKLEQSVSGTFVIVKDPHDNLFFWQKIPSCALSQNEAILIGDNDNLIDFIQEQCSFEKQYEILKNKKKLEEDNVALNNVGDFFLEREAYTTCLHFVNGNGEKEIEGLSTADNCFRDIGRLIEVPERNKKTLEQLIRNGKYIKHENITEKFIDQPVGSYYLKGSHLWGYSLSVKLPCINKISYADIVITRYEDIHEKIESLNSLENQYRILKKQERTFTREDHLAMNFSDAKAALQYKNVGEYIIWKSANKIQLLINKGDPLTEEDVIELDSSKDLFEQIDAQLTKAKLEFKSNFEDAGFTSTPAGVNTSDPKYIKETLYNAKDDFLSILKPSLSSQEKRKTTFTECLEIWKQTAKEAHPDKNPQGEERFKEILNARELLIAVIGRVANMGNEEIFNRPIFEDLDKKYPL